MSRHILLVDDDSELLSLLVIYLAASGDGYEVETACSGKEAVSKMEVDSFDLVITDLYMPGMDGLALIQYVRQHSPNTPVILMTSSRSSEIAADAYELGVYKKLDKPLSKKRFLSVVRQALESPELDGV